jgi:hypothetical protein
MSLASASPAIRSAIPQQLFFYLRSEEHKARSKATQLIHDTPLIVGGLVEMANTCGKPNCKCASGEKHKSWCVFLRHKGKRKMIHIPRDLTDAGSDF